MNGRCHPDNAAAIAAMGSSALKFDVEQEGRVFIHRHCLFFASQILLLRLWLGQGEEPE